MNWKHILASFYFHPYFDFLTAFYLLIFRICCALCFEFTIHFLQKRTFCFNFMVFCFNHFCFVSSFLHPSKYRKSVAYMLFPFSNWIHFRWCLKVRVKNSDLKNCNLMHKIMIIIICVTVYRVYGMPFESYDGNTVDQLQLSIINFICISMLLNLFYSFSFHKFSIDHFRFGIKNVKENHQNSHRPNNLKSKTKHLLATLRWFVLISDCYLLQMPFFPILIFPLAIRSYILFFSCMCHRSLKIMNIMPIYPSKRHHIAVYRIQHAFSIRH